MHKSATCALILAEDRQIENEDGTLQKVALKCMKNLSQFLTELSVREGLEKRRVVGALRAHVPPDFMHEMEKRVSLQPLKDASDVEPKLEANNFRQPHAHTAASTLFGVELWREEALANDAADADERLTGQYVIVMECADCDLGSDISHGHYAGRDKLRVQQLLRKIAHSFKYCEEQGIVHGDIKCVYCHCPLHCFATNKHPLHVFRIFLL